MFWYKANAQMSKKLVLKVDFSIRSLCKAHKHENTLLVTV